MRVRRRDGAGRRSRCALFGALGCALGAATFCPPEACAQTPQEVAAARRAFHEGEDAEAHGDVAVALAKFREALAHKETPQLHLRIGAVEEKLGRLVDALASYEQGLAKASALPAVAKVARELAEGLRPRVPVVTVTIAQPPPDLTVTIDGVPIDLAKLGGELRIDPGAHRVHAQAPGWRSRDQTFTASEHGRARVAMDLLPADATPTAPPPATDGATGSRLPGGLMLGGGMALLAIGIGVLADSYVKDGTINTECGGSARLACPLASKSTIESQVNGVNAFRGTGIVLAIAGAALGGTGIYFLARTPPATTSGLRFLPYVGADGARATFIGRF